jgi:hypothetical protein
MRTIAIADRLWLEPTLLGATLNFSDQPQGWHYRVGIGFRSLGECDKTLRESGSVWILKDKSLMVQGGSTVILTFCPGTYMERHFVLSGQELQTFKNAIHFLTLSSEPRQN